MHRVIKNFKLEFNLALTDLILTIVLGNLEIANLKITRIIIVLALFFGVKGRLKLTNVISLLAECNYSFRGESYRLPNLSIKYWGGNGNNQAYFSKDHQLNYLELPVLFSFNFSRLLRKELPDENFQVYFSTGLTPGVNTSSSFRYNEFIINSHGSPLNEVEEDYTRVSFDYAEKYIINYVADLSLNFNSPEATEKFVNLRLSQTLNNVYRIEELQLSNSHNMKTKMITISLGFGVMF